MPRGGSKMLGMRQPPPTRQGRRGEKRSLHCQDPARSRDAFRCIIRSRHSRALKRGRFERKADKYHSQEVDVRRPRSRSLALFSLVASLSPPSQSPVAFKPSLPNASCNTHARTFNTQGSPFAAQTHTRIPRQAAHALFPSDAHTQS